MIEREEGGRERTRIWGGGRKWEVENRGKEVGRERSG